MPEPYAETLATVARGRTALVARLRAIASRVEELPLDAAAEVDPALHAAAVPISERPARRAALEETLRALEVQEELLIVAAERRGQRIDRRADARPEIIFDSSVLEEIAPPAA